jgi:UDP-N-acetylglucosamine 2-epimerase (non-hydrolysing)
MSDLVAHVTGARPNFPKAAPVIRALDARGVPQQLVHTGQHYDERMSEVFFRQLGLPEPDIDLGVGSDTHARQTAAIMTGLEDLFTTRPPAMVVVYGDVNSTVAAALVASKMQVPLAHVEAGLRSFDMTMPEEINRLVTDRLSDLLFATSPDAVAHLGNEGVHAEKIHLVGNPMIDTLLANLDRLDSDAARAAQGLTGRFVVATLHRPGNVDDPADAQALTKAMHGVADQVDVVLPLHPRGRARLEAAGLFDHPGMRIIDPLGYVEFLGLVRGADAVVTDSGGVIRSARSPSRTAPTGWSPGSPSPRSWRSAWRRAGQRRGPSRRCGTATRVSASLRSWLIRWVDDRRADAAVTGAVGRGVGDGGGRGRSPTPAGRGTSNQSGSCTGPPCRPA